MAWLWPGPLFIKLDRGSCILVASKKLGCMINSRFMQLKWCAKFREYSANVSTTLKGWGVGYQLKSMVGRPNLDILPSLDWGSDQGRACRCKGTTNLGFLLSRPRGQGIYVECVACCQSQTRAWLKDLAGPCCIISGLEKTSSPRK